MVTLDSGAPAKLSPRGGVTGRLHQQNEHARFLVCSPAPGAPRRPDTPLGFNLQGPQARDGQYLSSCASAN